MTGKENWRDILRQSGIEDKSGPSASLRTSVSTFLHKYYEQFTDIQSKSIQEIYDGENALLVSQTASGKTEATVIPLAAA